MFSFLFQLEATKVELLASALDEKCQDDWGNPKLPSFKDQVRAKFEVQALMVDINHKRYRRVMSESSNHGKNFQFFCKVSFLIGNVSHRPLLSSYLCSIFRLRLTLNTFIMGVPVLLK